MNDPDLTRRIAAVVPPAGQSADALVHTFVSALSARGIRVRGLVQQICPDPGQCKFSLLDIATGQRYPISQDLGSASASCSLDPAGVAEATEVIRRIDDAQTDLVVFNRFSGLEADGEGFAQEMLEIMSRGLPVLTIVRSDWLPAWRHFTGGMSCELPAELAALESWFAQLTRD